MALIAGIGGAVVCAAAVAVCAAAGAISLGVSLLDSAERNWGSIRRGSLGGFGRDALISVGFSRLRVAKWGAKAGVGLVRSMGRSVRNLQHAKSLAAQVRLYAGGALVGAELGASYATHAQ